MASRGRHGGGPAAEPMTSGRNAVDPPLLHPPYVSTLRRAPARSLLRLPHTRTELSGPLFGDLPLGPDDHDLTEQHAGEPLGERIIVHGRLTDLDGRPVRGALIEVWQANAAGRYVDPGDDHRAPLDPNFTGAGRRLTGDDGSYEFTTIRPGAYPWRNHLNAWRPAHIHFSVMGASFEQRLVTQMYFPGDPLFAQDPIYNSVPDPAARQLLVSSLDLKRSVPEWALAYRFDIVLASVGGTPMEEDEDV